MRVRAKYRRSEDAELSDEQLKSLCRLWQKRLKLQDWRIAVFLADSGEMNGAQGDAHFQREKKLGVIRILRPEAFDETDQYHKAFPDVFDVERTLIHELLHAPLDGLFETEENTEQHKHDAQEQCVEQLTDALYAAYGKED